MKITALIPVLFVSMSYANGVKHNAEYVTRSLSLKESVLQMLQYEPELNAAEYDTLSAIGDFRTARSELRPRLSMNTSHGYTDRDRSTDGLFRGGENLLQREIGLSLRQLVYDGGVAKNNAESARNAHIAQQLTEKSLIEERVVDLSEVYLEVIRARRQIDLARKNVENHADMAEMLKERALVGGSRADVGLVQGRLQLANNTLSTQRLALELAESRFSLLVGVRPGKLSYPSIPDLPSTWQSIDISSNFDRLAAREALESAEHRFLAVKNQHKPQFYFDAGISRGQNSQGVRGADNSASALLVGSWDIFSGGRKKSLECREHFQVGKFEELVRAADVQSRYNLRNIWQERQGSANSVTALSNYVLELAQVNSDYEEQFRIGRQELLNILDIQQEHYSASSRLLDAKFDKDQSSYRIMGIQGKLTSHIIGNGVADGYCKNGKESACEKGCHPDNRVPVTQTCLMADKFDGHGPVVEMCPTTRQAYYEAKCQFPLECDCEGKCSACKKARKIGFDKRPSSDSKGFGKFQLFKKLKKSHQKITAPIRAVPVKL